jgi:hypothetical protein
MLSKALQRNAKHEARLSNISDLFLAAIDAERPEILRFARNDNRVVKKFVLIRRALSSFF